jgi:hypothetical protein
MAQTDDTTARSAAWHEANDRTQQISGPGEDRPVLNSRGEMPDAEARRIEHGRKNTDADDSLVPVEDRKAPAPTTDGTATEGEPVTGEAAYDTEAAVAAYDAALAEGKSITEANAAGLAAGRTTEGDPLAELRSEFTQETPA